MPPSPLLNRLRTGPGAPPAAIEATDPERVFAFGSNMCSTRLADYGVTALALGQPACLAEHTLRFDKLSAKDGSGKANVAPHPTDNVWGVLYLLSPDDLRRLDTGEGPGYHRSKLRVRTSGGEWKKAWVYVAKKPEPNRRLLPYDWYKAMLVAGAKQHCLPRAYVRRLKSIPAGVDPKSDRAAERAALVPGRRQVVATAATVRLELAKTLFRRWIRRTFTKPTSEPNFEPLTATAAASSKNTRTSIPPEPAGNTPPRTAKPRNLGPMNVLDWIDVGKVSAERDDNLSSYFFDNGVTQKVVDNRSLFLVLGRKGAGKTAVFRYLSENPSQFLTERDLLVALSFEDYNWNVHALLGKREAAGSLAYKQSWRFVILVEALKAYAGAVKREGGSLPRKARLAINVLERLFDSPVPTIYQIVGRKLLSLSKLRLPKAGMDLGEGGLDSIDLGGGEVSFEDVAKDDTLQAALSQNVDSLIAFLEDALEEAEISDRRIFVCFDRVDEAWDDVSIDISKLVVAGLVSAADSVSAKHGAYLRPIVFLREDIFETLSLNDANKLREDCGALLHWSKESLFKLILARINFFGKEAGVDAIDDIDDLFDKREMRQRTRPSNYLLKRSMMRPRDMICFLRRVIDVMKEQANDPFADEEVQATDRLSTDAIYEAEAGYSEWLRKELFDEWRVQYPAITTLLEILQNHGSTNIDYSSLAGGIEATGAKDRSALIQQMTFLFDTSVIGFKVGESTTWRFKCFYPAQGFVEAEDFHVHDGLIRALNLKEPREKTSESS